MSAKTTRGPSAAERATNGYSVRLRVADTIGAYRRGDYFAMHHHALKLVAIARQNGASHDLNAADIENPHQAGTQLVDAHEDGDTTMMARLASGLLEIASREKRNARGGSA